MESEFQSHVEMRGQVSPLCTRGSLLVAFGGYKVTASSFSGGNVQLLTFKNSVFDQNELKKDENLFYEAMGFFFSSFGKHGHRVFFFFSCLHKAFISYVSGFSSRIWNF